MLENLKEELIRVAVAAQRQGLCKHKSGNFSIRDKETGYIVITPSGIDRELLTVDQVSVIDSDLNLIEGLNPSSECMMHNEIYKLHPDVFGIAHTHSIMATSFAVLNRPIPATIYEFSAFKIDGVMIPVAPYGRPGTTDLAKSVAETSLRSDLMLMEKHGAIAIGPTLDLAYLAVSYIEEFATIYYNTLTIGQGKEPEHVSLEELHSWKYPEQVKGAK